MGIFLAGLVVFFAIHSVRMVAPGFRDERLLAMGTGPWKGLYSLVSLVGLALLIWGWMLYRLQAPEIYVAPDWGRHAAALLVPIAFVLQVAAYLPQSHIAGAVKHPFLLSVMLWSVGHLLANGDLASLILFGSFLVYAVVDRIAVSARPESEIVTHNWRDDILALVIGLAAAGVFAFFLHGLLFGVSPF